MRLKTWLKYLCYTLCIIGVAALEEYITIRVSYYFLRSWGGNYSYYLLIAPPLVLNILIGLLLGLEHYWKELKHKGRWRVNVPRVILMGVPFLLIGLFNFLILINSFSWLSRLGKYGADFISVSQILTGYIIITSFYKDHEVSTVNGDKKTEVSADIDKLHEEE